MKKIMMLIGLTLIFWAPPLKASVFDEAAKLYIDGKMNQARQLIELGLKQNPGDEKLRALLEKIKEQKEKNKQSSSSQDKSGKNDDKKDQDKQKQDQKDKDKDKEERQKQQDEQQQPQKGDEQKEQQASGQKQKISREEAQRILNALRESEKEAQKKKPPIKVPARRKTDKDW